MRDGVIWKRSRRIHLRKLDGIDACKLAVAELESAMRKAAQLLALSERVRLTLKVATALRTRVLEDTRVVVLDHLNISIG